MPQWEHQKTSIVYETFHVDIITWLCGDFKTYANRRHLKSFIINVNSENYNVEASVMETHRNPYEKECKTNIQTYTEAIEFTWTHAIEVKLLKLVARWVR